MIKGISLVLLSVLVAACQGKAIKQGKCKHELNFFRTPQSYKFFQLNVEGNFNYVDSFGIESNTPVAFFVAKYCAAKDSLNFYLRIDDRDTSFRRSAIDSDSLLLGITYDKKFIIFKKEDYIWKVD